MPHKIGAYIRVSTEEQASAVEGSLDNQKYRLNSFVDLKNAQSKQWGKIIEYYVDDGFSAKDTRRPAFQKMLSDIKKGKIDLILICDISRLSRNIADFCVILADLEKFQAQFLSIKEQFDTSTPVGKMMIYNMINLAQFEREQISERVSLGVHARAMRGLLNGARPILGFDKDPSRPGTYIVNQGEASDVKRIFRTFLNNGSKAKTIQELQALGIKPKNNLNTSSTHGSNKWNSTTLGCLLSSTAYIGRHEVNKRNKSKSQEGLKPHKQYRLVDASWPAIIDDDTFWKAQKLLEEARLAERVRLDGAENRFYILTGILRCSECGSSLVGKTAHGERSIHRYYQHTNANSHNKCRVQRVVADEVEKAVIEYLWAATKNAGYLTSIESKLKASRKIASIDTARDKRKIKEELKETQAKIDNLLLMRGQSSANADSIKFMMDLFESLSKERATLTDKLKRLEDEPEIKAVIADSVVDIQENLNEFKRGFAKAKGALRKRLIRQLLKQVVLSEEGLHVFMFLAAGFDVPNERIQLIKEPISQEPEKYDLFLGKKASGDDSNLLVLSSPIGKNGDSGTTRTYDPLLRRELQG